MHAGIEQRERRRQLSTILITGYDEIQPSSYQSITSERVGLSSEQLIFRSTASSSNLNSAKNIRKIEHWEWVRFSVVYDRLKYLRILFAAFGASDMIGVSFFVFILPLYVRSLFAKPPPAFSHYQTSGRCRDRDPPARCGRE